MENELILFETADKEIKLTVPIKNNTVWLNRKQLAELFGRDVKTIGKHINNALKEELDNSVVANFATTTSPASSSRIALLMCLRMVFESLPNNSAIWLAFNHTVSLSISTLNCVSPSAER